MRIRRALSLFWLAAAAAAAQEQYDGGYYEQDGYAQDNLYADYAARQQEKERQVAG